MSGLIGLSAATLGALSGVGILLVVRGIRPAPRRIDIAVARLTGEGPLRRSEGALDTSWARGLVGQAATPALAWAERVVGTKATDAELRLAGWTRTGLVVRKLAWGLVGLVAPTLLVIPLQIAGIGVPLAFLAVAAAGFGIVFFLLPDRELRQRATRARMGIRRAACAYLDLVALERAAGSGAVEALEEAARICDSHTFRQIATTLERAQLAGRTAWDGLRDLADTLEISALGDVADIVQLSGEDGAAVYDTLRARAASLRGELLAEATAQANADSERLVIPASLTVVVFIAFIGFPLMDRLLIS